MYDVNPRGDAPLREFRSTLDTETAIEFIPINGATTMTHHRPRFYTPIVVVLFSCAAPPTLFQEAWSGQVG